MKWKVKQGLQATYRNLLKLCCDGGHTSSAEAICEVLRKEAGKDDMLTNLT